MHTCVHPCIVVCTMCVCEREREGGLSISLPLPLSLFPPPSPSLPRPPSLSLSLTLSLSLSAHLRGLLHRARDDARRRGREGRDRRGDKRGWIMGG